MAESVDILIEDPRWETAGLARLAEPACGAALAHLGLDRERFEISLLACDDRRIAGLNTEFRGKPVPTNVLSWPSALRSPEAPGAEPKLPEVSDQDPRQELGDIAISFDTCMRESREAGREFGFHVTHLLVHATLHLLGYDHIDEQDAVVMETKEREILASMGYPNPYED